MQQSNIVSLSKTPGGERERGARRPRAVRETSRSKPNEAGRATSELASVRRPEGLKWRAHGAKRSAQPRNTGPLKAARCEGAGRPCRIVERSPFAFQSSPAACTAGTGRFLRRKIPFSRAKIVSLQFPRPKIRRILAETGEGGSGGRACSPVHLLVKKTFLTSNTILQQSNIVFFWRDTG